MASLNDNYLKLKAGYLFPEIGRRVKAFNDANPAAAARLIRCGIGDVTEPLPAAVVAALHKAVDGGGTADKALWQLRCQFDEAFTQFCFIRNAPDRMHPKKGRDGLRNGTWRCQGSQGIIFTPPRPGRTNGDLKAQRR